MKPRRVLIDGPSGSGKTTLSKSFSGYQILHLDDWYPGWHGLEEGSRIAEGLLSGELDAYPEWDWQRGQVARWVPVDRSKPWVIEGCGALTKKSAPLADLRIWLDSPPDIARTRGLERDGAAYLPWWEIWNQQEQEHWQQNRPWELADIVMDQESGLEL